MLNMANCTTSSGLSGQKTRSPIPARNFQEKAIAEGAQSEGLGVARGCSMMLPLSYAKWEFITMRTTRTSIQENGGDTEYPVGPYSVHLWYSLQDEPSIPTLFMSWRSQPLLSKSNYALLKVSIAIPAGLATSNVLNPCNMMLRPSPATL